MKQLSIVLASLFFSYFAEAACDSFSAPYAVRGKTYISQDAHNPGKISFNNDWSVTFQNLFSRHPGGKYFYDGTCYRGIEIVFRPTQDPDSETFVMRLNGADGSYQVLIDSSSGRLFTQE